MPSPGQAIKWSPTQGLEFEPLDPHEALKGNWVYEDGTGTPSTLVPNASYYGTPTGFASIAHPRLIKNFKEPSYHSINLDNVERRLINELELKAYPRNHGREKWICLASQSGFAASPYATSITEWDSTGTTVLNTYALSGPGRVSIAFTAGRLYSSDRPAYFYSINNARQHVIAPLTLSGTSFAHYSSRYSETTFYIYAFDNATIEIFQNDPNGIAGTTPTNTITAFAATIHTWNTTTSDPTFVCIRSSGRIVVTAVENVPDGDSVIVPPASHVMYRQRSGPVLTVKNGVPAGSATHVNWDVAEKLASIVIGDGSGGDASMGLGIEHLSNRYIFSDLGLSDYLVTSPFPAEVEVYYWDDQAQTPTWVLASTEDLTASTLLAPVGVGQSGPDIGGSYDDSGNASYFSFSGYTPETWKFESDYPFYVYVNNSNNDEETLLGWCEYDGIDYNSIPWPTDAPAIDAVLFYYDDWLIIE